MIAAATRFARNQSKIPLSAEAIICEIDGKPNIGSAKALTRNGFYHAERTRGKIEHSNSHFLLSDPKHVGTIAVHKLVASSNDLIEFGDWILKDWEEIPV
ncbi:hypothetical protein RGAI101_141 [Roseobacter sp. GAI101]|nr:hypothetical protein RGAI101_141 [Roseobacter sp. GAI101]